MTTIKNVLSIIFLTFFTYAIILFLAGFGLIEESFLITCPIIYDLKDFTSKYLVITANIW